MVKKEAFFIGGVYNEVFIKKMNLPTKVLKIIIILHK